MFDRFDDLLGILLDHRRLLLLLDQLGEPENPVEGVVDFVGHGGRQGAEGGKLFSMHQVFAKLLLILNQTPHQPGSVPAQAFNPGGLAIGNQRGHRRVSGDIHDEIGPASPDQRGGLRGGRDVEEASLLQSGSVRVVVSDADDLDAGATGKQLNQSRAALSCAEYNDLDGLYRSHGQRRGSPRRKYSRPHRRS